MVRCFSIALVLIVVCGVFGGLGFEVSGAVAGTFHEDGSYDGELPPGCHCPNCMCKSASCDQIISPYCTGGSTAGCENDSLSAACFYSWSCPWGVGNSGVEWWLTHSYSVGSCQGASNYVGCVKCNPYSGTDNEDNCGEGQKKCGASCVPDPCGPGMSWNYETCQCDCMIEEGCNFIYRVDYTESGVAKKRCFELDPMSFDDTSWIYPEIQAVVNPSDYIYVAPPGVNRWGVNYYISTEFWNPCEDEYEECGINPVLIHYPNTPVFLTECTSVSMKSQYVSWDDSIPATVHIDNLDFGVITTSSGKVYLNKSTVLLCAGLVHWVGPCPYWETEVLKLSYTDRSSWPSCSSYSNNFRILNQGVVSGSGGGGSVRGGVSRESFKYGGGGGLQMRD